jgi:hypothetical protein
MKPFGWMCVRENVANVKMLPFTKSNFQLRRRHDETIGNWQHPDRRSLGEGGWNWQHLISVLHAESSWCNSRKWK